MPFVTSVSAMISDEIGPLGGSERPVGDLDRGRQILVKEVGAGELSEERDEPWIRVEIGEFARAAFEDLDRF